MSAYPHTIYGIYNSRGEFISRAEAEFDWHGLPEGAEGDFDDIPWTCPHCDGECQVVEELVNDQGEVAFERVACPLCKGEGIDPAGPRRPEVAA